jgi:putative ABC transport system permease protein
MRLRETFEAIRQDITFALRAIRRQRTFSFAVLVTLAVAIGACTAVFGVTYAVMLRRLPYPTPDRIVSLVNAPAGFTPTGVALKRAIRESPLLEAAALYIEGGNAVVGVGTPTRARVTQTSPRFFSVFGMAPRLGRTFGAEEGVAGRNAVTVVSHGFFERVLGGNPKLVGEPIVANGHRFTVVGVMPPAFDFPGGTEMWVPLPSRFGFFNNAHGWETIGRLKPGVAPLTVRSTLAAVFADEAQQRGFTADDDLEVVPLQAHLAASVRRTLLTLLAAVGLVLLVACANVASLWSARGLARERELAIRQTLGAGRARLSRLIIVEALLLSGAGGIAGVALAAVIQKVLIANAPAALPRLSEIGMHGPVLVFGVALSVVVGLVCGLVPLRRVSDAALRASMLGGRQGGSSSIGWHGGTPLVVGEVALASLLTVGAGLLIRSYVNAERTSLGFDGRGVLTARIDLPPSDTASAVRDEVVARLVDAIRTIPGVKRAAVTDDIPLAVGMTSGYRVQLADSVATDSTKTATIHAATPGYFAAMGIPLLRGRDFTAADRRGAPHVYIITDSLRKRLVGNGDAIGRRLAVTMHDTGTIVGVVADVQHRGPELPVNAQFYEPYAQSFATAVGITLRSDERDVTRLAPLVRQAVRRVAPELAPYDFVSMPRLVARAMSARRFILGLLVSFAFVALALTAVGVYGVVSYAVERRRRELGIRAALGARAEVLVALALRRSVLAAVAGVSIALVAVIPLRSLVAHFLFGVSPLDPLTLAGVVLTTLGVALVASLVPGLRAGRVDPAQALRAE